MSFASQSVAGSILCDAACLHVVRPLVSRDDFAFAADRAIFEAACRLEDEGAPADVLTILEDARKHGADVSDKYAAELLQITRRRQHMPKHTPVKSMKKPCGADWQRSGKRCWRTHKTSRSPQRA